MSTGLWIACQDPGPGATIHAKVHHGEDVGRWVRLSHVSCVQVLVLLLCCSAAAEADVRRGSPPAYALLVEYAKVKSTSTTMHRNDTGKPMLSSDAVGTLLQQSADQAAANSTH